MTGETTRRGALATVAGGAVALTGAAAAYAYEPPEPVDPAKKLAEQWWTARNNLHIRWPRNAIVAKEIEASLRHVVPTTMVGALAVLAIAIETMDLDGPQVLHHHLACDRVVTFDWLRNVHAAISNGRAS